MRARVKIDPAELLRRGEGSRRRKAANDFARDVRLGEIRLNGWSIHERPDPFPCWTCGWTGRTWHAAQWRPAFPGATIGAIIFSPQLCALCCWQRMTPADEEPST